LPVVAALHLLVDSYDPLLPIAMQLRPERGFDALQSNQPSQRDGNRDRNAAAPRCPPRRCRGDVCSGAN